MPRAAISVAISTGTVPARKPARARSRWPCDLLPWMAAALMPSVSSRLTALSAPRLVRVNTITRSPLRARIRPARAPILAGVCMCMTECSTLSAVFLAGTTETSVGFFQVTRGELADFLGHGRREQQGLAIVRGHRQNALDCRHEADVEHLVGLVEHHHFDLVQGHGALLDQVHQAARGGDENIDPAGQRLDLRADRHAADHHGRGQVQLAAVILDALGDLGGEFAGRRKDQRRGLSSARLSCRAPGGAGSAARTPPSCRCRSAPAR